MKKKTLNDVLILIKSVKERIDLFGTTSSALKEFDNFLCDMKEITMEEWNITEEEALKLPLNTELKQKGTKKFLEFKEWFSDLKKK